MPIQKKHFAFNPRKYIKNFLSGYIFYIIALLISVGLSLFIPFYLSRCIDNIVNTAWSVSIGTYLMTFFLVVLSELIFYIFMQNGNVKLSNEMAFMIEYETLGHIKHVPFSAIKKYNDTYLTQRINNDAVVIGDYYIEKLPYFVSNILLLIAAYVMVFSINFKLGILFIGFICIYGLGYFISKKILYVRRQIMLETQGNFFAMLSNQIFNILTIKVNSWYEETDHEFARGVVPFFKSSVKFLRINFIVSGANLFMNRVLYGCSIIILGIDLFHGNVSLGELATITIYIQILLSKMQEVSGFGQQREQFRVASDRINELFQLPMERNGGTELEIVDSITVKGIGVNYEDKIVFYKKNADFKRGKVYLITGENGSGKTTFIYTLLGIVEANYGNIFFNDKNLDELDIYSLRRKNIAVACQEPVLQNGTIYENLVYGLEEKELRLEKDVQSEGVCELLDFTKRLEKGLDTMITSKNITLSGGEKQKIEICRILLKNADVLIFDEPTSALDAESIECFLREIERIKKEHIIIIISHDEKLKKAADEILAF